MRPEVDARGKWRCGCPRRASSSRWSMWGTSLSCRAPCTWRTDTCDISFLRSQLEVSHHRLEHSAPKRQITITITFSIFVSLSKSPQYLAGSLFQTPPRTFSSLIECLTTLPPLVAREKDSFIAFFFFKGLCVPFTSSDINWRQVPTFSKEFKVYNTITFW